MESPIYKLEKVVQGKEELQDFEGPLDLILFLLSKNKIEIQDIPIALILDQYLAYLDRRKEMDLEVASEFVTMAAHLMYIKTRMLLSLEDEEAKNEMDALIQSLAERQRGEAYARVRRLAELLGIRQENVACVGDHANDISMLNWAGMAFAPANALPQVLALPQVHRLPDCRDNAIAALIQVLDEKY